MKVDSKELVAFTDFRRELTDVMEELRKGTIQKAVVTKHGKPECVLLTVEQYQRLKGSK